MNAIRQTALLNKRELETATPPSASWHVDYRDTAWIYVGGLPLDLSEGDVVTIFSQFGNPTHLNLIRDKETGKLKGFGFLKYEDQRSCDLAVDNLGGAEVLGRMLRVDHTRYKRKEGEDEDTYRIERMEAEAERESGKRASDTEEESGGEGSRKRRKLLKEERELEEMLAITRDGEDEDPMRQYLIREKREEVDRAKEREQRKHKHKHHHRRKNENGDEADERRHYHKLERRNKIADDDQESRREVHRTYREGEERREKARERRRSWSRDRDDHNGQRRAPRTSRSSSLDGQRRRRDRLDRSRSPKRRPRFNDED